MGEVTQAWDAQGNPIPSATASQPKQAWDASGKPIAAPMDQMSAQPSFMDNLKSTIMHPLNSLESAAQPVSRPANASLGEMVGTDIRNAAAGAASVIRHPLNAAAGIAGSGFGIIPAATTIGNALAKPITGYQEPGATERTMTPEVGAQMIGQSAATAGLIKGGIAAAPAVGDVMAAAADVPGAGASPKPAPYGQNYTPQHAAAFEGALAPAPAMGRNFQPQSITPQALSPIRQTAARMAQGSPLEQVTVQAATNPSTPPLTRIKAYQGVVQSALNDLEAQHAQGLAGAADTPVNIDPLVQELRSHISATTDPADVAAIRNLIQRTRQVQNIGDLNTFRQELNNETSAEFKQSQIQAGRSGTSVQAASDLAGAVRGAYYDNLSNATGVNYQPLKLQESNLLTTKEALQNQQSSLAKQEATFNAPSTLKEQIGNVANILKDPKATVTQTLLRESPATRISTLLQKSLADLPPAPQSAPMLGAGAPTPRPMPAPAGPQGGPTPPPPVYAGSAASRLGRMLPAPPIELPGAVQQNIPAYSPDTAPARLGRLLTPSAGPTILGPDAAAMTPGERTAALMQLFRRQQQLSLPAKASPLITPPPQ